jgi:hypothetical protein
MFLQGGVRVPADTVVAAVEGRPGASLLVRTPANALSFHCRVDLYTSLTFWQQSVRWRDAAQLEHEDGAEHELRTRADAGRAASEGACLI